MIKFQIKIKKQVTCSLNKKIISKKELKMQKKIFLFKDFIKMKFKYKFIKKKS